MVAYKQVEKLGLSCGFYAQQSLEMHKMEKEEKHSVRGSSVLGRSEVNCQTGVKATITYNRGKPKNIMMTFR